MRAMRPLLLASTSKFRAAMLRRLGVPFQAAAPRFEEIAEPGESPRAIAQRFALGKAASLRAEHPAAVIVGSDQVCELEGEVFGKPKDLDGAADQLLRLQGRVHQLHTAVAVLDAARGRALEELVTVDLAMRPLTKEQIARYLALDQPLGSCGGYTFEGRGVALFDRIEGGDDSAIVGLPLLALGRLLRAQGWDPLDAWEAP